MRQQSNEKSLGKKLSLSKDTLRQLDRRELNNVAGGTVRRTRPCPDSPTQNCTGGC